MQSVIFYDAETGWKLRSIGQAQSGKFYEFENMENGNTSFYPIEDLVGLTICEVINENDTSEKKEEV